MAVSGGRDRYLAHLRSSVRGLWTGALDTAQFSDAMFSGIRRFLTLAWLEGSMRCGIGEADLSPEELVKREQVIVAEFGYVAGFADAINAGSKAVGGGLAPLFARAELWANRYPEVATMAELMACRDQKKQWRMNPRKEHCGDCKKLHGKVKRASVWEAAGVHPNAYELECGPGRKCGCALEDTNDPITPGPLPKLANA